MIITLLLILILVFVLPFLFKWIENQLEIFLLLMGFITLTLTNQWTYAIIKSSLIEPLKITSAVFIAGILFRLTQKFIDKNVNKISQLLGLNLFVFLIVFGLGMVSSVITAIIAALLLVEIISYLKFDKKSKTKIAILSCFSIGIGAALTPIGEPLSTIAIAKLQNFPYYADFWFILKNIGSYIISALIILGLIAAYISKKSRFINTDPKEYMHENIKDVFIRSFKVYIFIVGLIFLGNGLKPLVWAYISKISFYLLFWINSVSAVVDNATLTAAEINPSLSLIQIKVAILSLVVAGGILIPGNIPNIIVAGKLKIKSKDWAKFGIPVGISLMIIYFLLIVFFR